MMHSTQPLRSKYAIIIFIYRKNHLPFPFPSARFNNIDMLHTSRPQEFLRERNVLFKPRSGRASYEVASNKFYLFDCKSRNQYQHVARLGDLDNIFSRSRPSLSRLRRQGAVRALPCSLCPPLHST